ncbi:3-hydroxybenzoate 6-hydroxylase [Actinomadura sp. CNU-125]|uniref:FAD-dependent oxidoreductase n=1 Tax=Actinomadura sp. CNU-125 TaxID=1904961 RepID=UPI000960C106|nr:FAD-dependent oxidoreductase [Actinomadura sp. CNU-125]OLT31132.1 3-hydroxybenzoate 6-hydroxylase [Actinomadura sp. CNU-125]
MNAAPGSTDVVVVGGGIGGLATAYALASSGHSVAVLERAPEFTEVGAGLQMAPNATRILKEWGLLDEVVRAGVTPRRMVYRDALDGSELTHLDLDDGFVRRYGAPYVVMHRSDLLSILARACERAGVRMVPDCEVTDVVTDGDAAIVRSARGEFRGGLAVGADGLRSTLRGKLSDDEPICSGYVAYRGAFPVEELGSRLDKAALDEVVAYIGPGRHLVQYALRGGEMFNTVAVFKSPAYERGERDWGGPDELDAAFAGSCDEVRQGIGSLWRDRRWPMYDRLPIPGWTDGRLVLTGDAAHPMLQYLAQGACQAIEDAHVLASGLGGGETDWTGAVERFEAERTARTARVQNTARVWGDIWHVDEGAGRMMRNELFRLRDPRDYKYVDWLYAKRDEPRV